MSNTLTNYFAKLKTSTTSENIVKKNEEKKTEDNFYENCVYEKKCYECDKKKAQIKIKINELKEKIVEYENMTKTVRSVIAEKDEEINRLKGKSFCETVANIIDSNPAQSFETFTNFNSEQLQSLRAIGPDERGDSTFVLHVIKFLYADRFECLATKSACGRKNKSDGSKTMMTPQTKQILERIYLERLNRLGISPSKQNIRYKKVNKLIKDAFTNITKSIPPKDVCRKLFDELKE